MCGSYIFNIVNLGSRSAVSTESLDRITGTILDVSDGALTSNTYNSTKYTCTWIFQLCKKSAIWIHLACFIDERQTFCIGGRSRSKYRFNRTYRKLDPRSVCCEHVFFIVTAWWRVSLYPVVCSWTMKGQVFDLVCHVNSFRIQAIKTKVRQVSQGLHKPQTPCKHSWQCSVVLSFSRQRIPWRFPVCTMVRMWRSLY